MTRTGGKEPGVMKTKKTPRRHKKKAKSPQRLGQGSQEEWTARPNPIKPPGKRTTKKSKAPAIDKARRTLTTPVDSLSQRKRGTAAVAVGPAKRPRSGGGTSTGTSIGGNSNSSIGGIGGGGGGGSSGGAGGVVVPKHPSDAKRDVYRYHPENTTVMRCKTLNGRLEDVDTRANIVREVGAVLDRLSGSDIELQPALREMWGVVARILTDSGGLPEEVLPFFLHPRYEPPLRGQSCALVGFMCPTHDDNIGFSGATVNRTIILHRLIESAVVERGHHKSLCVNVNCFRCLKNGDGSYVNPCVRDDEVTRLSQLALAIYFAALYAIDVEVTRIVQSCGSEDIAKGPFHLGPWGAHFPDAERLLNLSITPFFSSPHLTATKVDRSYHEGLAAKVAAQIIQARLGEERSRFSDAGRAVFKSVGAGTSEAAFRSCPEDVGGPTCTSGSAASTQAISALKSRLEELLTGSLPSPESAASVVSRLFSSPSEDEAKRSSKAARVANAAEFGRLVADSDGVKNSGVAGSLS